MRGGSVRSLRAREVGGRVAVLSRNDAHTIDDVLDGLAEACPSGVEVVVVDLDSTDASADVAIRHPRVDRVVVAPDADLDVLLEVTTGDTPRLAILRADRRPAPGWLTAAFEALDDADVAFG